MNGRVLSAAVTVAVVVSLMSGAQAQFVSSCTQVLADLAAKEIRVFVDATGIDNINGVLCVDFSAFV